MNEGGRSTCSHRVVSALSILTLSMSLAETCSRFCPTTTKLFCHPLQRPRHLQDLTCPVPPRRDAGHHFCEFIQPTYIAYRFNRMIAHGHEGKWERMVSRLGFCGIARLDEVHSLCESPKETASW